MNYLVLTQYNGAILGPIAKLLGYLMNAIFNFCDMIGIPNIGLAIILFTILINLLLLPITFKQQKASKMNAVITPEIQKITAKYKGKKDQASMEKQQAEQRAVYEKYGVSMTAGCLPLLIQMPILFALYRVIYNIPSYVTSIKSVFMQIVDVAVNQQDFVSKITDLANANQMSPDKYLLDGSTTESLNYIVDLFYKFDRGEWKEFLNIFPGISDQVQPHINQIMSMDSFLGGISLAEAPGFKLSIALIIPFLAWLTQWLSTKLMTSVNNSQMDDSNNTMAATMKSMNTFMPIMSAVFCITLPAGLGVYWIASAVVRILQQLGINAYMDKISVEDIIEKNKNKQNKKRAKQGLPPIKENANLKGYSTKNTMVKPEIKEASMPSKKTVKNMDTSEYYKEQEYKEGSIASKARMVQNYNEKKTKK